MNLHCFPIYMVLKFSKRNDVIPIFNQPIVIAAFSSVAYSEHAVVESGGAACWLAVHSLPIQLERLMAGVDGDRDWADGGDSFLEFVLLHVGDVHVSSVSGADVFFLEMAESVLE